MDSALSGTVTFGAEKVGSSTIQQDQGPQIGNVSFMKHHALLVTILMLLAIVGRNSPVGAQHAVPDALVERIGDTGFIQLQANSFNQLDARKQALAYWLTQASIAIDP